MAQNWSSSEIDAIVEDYFDMLKQEQAGQRFDKTRHRRALMNSISRSKGSIIEAVQAFNIRAIKSELRG